MLCLVSVIFSTSLLISSSCFGVVASQDPECPTFVSDNSSCPEAWHYWGNSCYRITESNFPWSKARDECRNLGGVLAVPSSSQESDFIANLIPWKCREGNVEVAYRNWYPGEPNDKEDEDCGMYYRRGITKWLDQCFTFMSDNSSCPESWHYWGNSCYKITETRFSWSEARDECRNLGGVLCVPSSDQENDVIVNWVPDDSDVWIDCNDQEVKGIWKCREGNEEITYRNWDPTQPDNKVNEQCVVLSKMCEMKRQWFDVSCQRHNMAVCKMAARPFLQV
ncbi:brevican core protein-like [Asterias amurensis]|uniref:brevican core protein-like n=1 Tax=Asterias amurensis TaxID=7602 RepID=UPI003AB868E3